MLITVVTVTHNSEDVIRDALRCVCAHPRVASCIVVDNASTDSTVSLIRSEFPAVKLLQNRENTGYGVACNQALEQVGTGLALLMNPDAVIDAAGIDRLAESFSAFPDAAIIAPYMSGQGEHQHFAAIKKIRHGVAGNAVPVPFISGAIAMWRMDCMKKVGFFDPAFFMFYEDDDISIRTRMAGYRLLAMKGINVRHVPGRSCKITEALQSMKLRSSTWSRLYITAKYRGAAVARMAALFLIARHWLALRGTDNRSALQKKQLESVLADIDAKWKAHKEGIDEGLAAATGKHYEKLTAAIAKRNARWSETEAELDRQWKAAQEKHQEGIRHEQDAFEEQWQQRIKHGENTDPVQLGEHERRWKEAMSQHQELWGSLVQRHEQARRETAGRHEQEWAAIEKELREELAGVSAAHDGRIAAEARHYEEWRMIIQKRSEELLPGINTKREREDILWAARSFLRNPRQYTNDAT